MQANQPQPQSRLHRLFSWDGWKGVGAVAATFTAIGAFFISFQSLQSTQDQYKLAQQTQITDRFTKAIDSLGSERAEVRAGGIFALERLSRDSLADRTTIMDTLGAYVRNHAPAPPPGPRSDNFGPAQEELRRAAVHCDVDPHVIVPIDIQAALAVIDRRDKSIADERRIDLSHACLADVFLPAIRLRDADLTGSDLTNADFLGRNLLGPLHTVAPVDFRYTHMFFATLSKAVVQYGCFQHAGMLNADLSQADFAWTDLRNAYLPGADLSKTDLNGAALEGANLIGANLSETHLEKVSWDASTKWPDGFTPPPSSDISHQASSACEGLTPP